MSVRKVFGMWGAGVLVAATAARGQGITVRVPSDASRPAAIVAGAGGATTQVPPEKAKGAVDAVLRQLASEDFAQRNKGEAAVENLPPAALELIEAAAVDPKVDGEVRDRLARALPKFEARALAARASEARERRREWLRAYWTQSYEKAGTRSAAWDDLVRQAITADTAARRGGENEGERREHIRSLYQAAVDKGCKDPFVLFRAATLMSVTDPHQMVPRARQFEAAAEAMVDSSYGGQQRLAALSEAAQAVRVAPHRDGADAQRIQRYGDLAAEAWPLEVQTPGVPTDMLSRDADKVVAMAGDGAAAARQLVLAALRKTMPGSAARQLVEANFTLDDLLNEVSKKHTDAEAWPVARGMTLKARHLLERAWGLDPTSGMVPSGMIRVAGRELTLRQFGALDPTEPATLPEASAEMERWFTRAMAVDPENEPAVYWKLQFLKDKPNRSGAELVRFGREMFAKGPWTSKIPQTLISVYSYMATQSGEDEKFYARPEVYKDLKMVFTELMKHDPEPIYDRDRFLKVAYLGGDYGTAAALCRELGENWAPDVFASMEGYNTVRRDIAAKLHDPASTRPAKPAAAASRPAS